MNISKSAIRLHASAKSVITNFLFLPGKGRVSSIISRMERLEETDVKACMEKVMLGFAGRHRHIERTFLNHFNQVAKKHEHLVLHYSDQKKLLLGAFFTKEYSIQAAALFNPSIVPHPDQQGLQPGEQRFVMSLRATGEGHISSIVFQTGIVDDKANITLDTSSGYFTGLEKKLDTIYTKKFIATRAAYYNGFTESMLDGLPDSFSASGAIRNLNSLGKKNGPPKSVKWLEKILDVNYELEEANEMPINEKVIFPNAKAECMGMEDARFVQFRDEDRTCYYGTYTAYNGKEIKTQLIETADFSAFTIRSLYGSAIADKGMALFPEKINGKFVMISRQGGEKINIMFSDDLYIWEKFETLMEPRFVWELVQLGNCGSPIRTDAGWLLLTHGVGVMRTYVISAVLLDLTNPARVIGRMDSPLIQADETEREGYVPNVVYTCGCMRHGNLLIIPYAVSDSATGFASIAIDDLLNEIKC